MTRNTQKNAQFVAALVALTGLFIGIFAPSVHWLVVDHSICEDHRQVVHDGHQHERDQAGNGHSHGSDAQGSGPASAALNAPPAHDICALDALLFELQRLPDAHSQPWSSRGPLALSPPLRVPAVRPHRAPIAILALAPQTPPPTTATTLTV